MLEADSIGERALAALRLENPNDTRTALQELIEEAPSRLDLRHSLATTLVRMGEAKAGKIVAEDAIRMAKEAQTEAAFTLIGQMYATHAAACEELYQPNEAEHSYKTILINEEGNPFALQGLAFLHFARGQTDEGISYLRSYTEHGSDEPDAIAANQQFIEAIEQFIRQEEDPSVFIEAHRGSYCEMFDHYESEMAKEGWIAEAARMRLDDDGKPTIPIVPEGSPEYAATRVDLVNPKTAQPGRIGDQPMIVAYSGFEVLAQAPILFSKSGSPFKTLISSRAPWNHLPIHIQMASSGPEVIEDFISDWYSAGYKGQFGTGSKGFFHEISPLERVNDNSMVFYVDMGRASEGSIEDLLSRLSILHEKSAIKTVVIGQGYLP